MNIVSMLADTVRSIFTRPATERYPQEQFPTPERLRGKLHWDPERCTGCCLCVKDCPADAIELITIDKKKKQFVMRYHMDRCTFCDQCVQNCRFECLSLSPDEWELASQHPAEFTVYYGDEDDIRSILENCAPAGDSQT